MILDVVRRVVDGNCEFSRRRLGKSVLMSRKERRSDHSCFLEGLSPRVLPSLLSRDNGLIDMRFIDAFLVPDIAVLLVPGNAACPRFPKAMSTSGRLDATFQSRSQISRSVPSTTRKSDEEGISPLLMT